MSILSKGVFLEATGSQQVKETLTQIKRFSFPEKVFWFCLCSLRTARKLWQLPKF